jgi:hypothetical protein
MNEETESPPIVRDSWGRIEIAGGGAFKDAKLFPGGAREWDWRETGTQHEPGIQPADVQELIDRGTSAVVLSRGRNGRLKVCAATLVLLEERGIDVHVLQTDEAIECYNELAKTERVGALIHSTC